MRIAGSSRGSIRAQSGHHCGAGCREGPDERRQGCVLADVGRRFLPRSASARSQQALRSSRPVVSPRPPSLDSGFAFGNRRSGAMPLATVAAPACAGARVRGCSRGTRLVAHSAVRTTTEAKPEGEDSIEAPGPRGAPLDVGISWDVDRGQIRPSRGGVRPCHAGAGPADAIWGAAVNVGTDLPRAECDGSSVRLNN